MKLDQLVKIPQFDQSADSLTHYFLSGVNKDKQGKRLLNKSGRVLGITGLGINLKDARDGKISGKSCQPGNFYLPHRAKITRAARK